MHPVRHRATHSLHLSLTALLLGSVALPGSLTAQADRVCQETADRFPAARDSANYPTLIGTIAACGAEFAHVVVSEWATPPADTTALYALSRVTAKARSPEVLASIRRIIADHDANPIARLAAMEATAGWVNPCMQIQLQGVGGDRNAHITSTTRLRAECDQGYGPTGPDTKEAKELVKLLERLRPGAGDNLAIRTAAAATATTLKLQGRVRP